MKETLLVDAFAACVDDIEAKGLSLDECLARYPYLRSELEPALRTVLDIKAVPPWEVSREFKATARQRIVRRIRNRKTQPTLWSRLAGLNPLTWPGRMVTAPMAVRVVAIVLALLLVVTGGTAIASTDTLPDNPLYQVKLAAESLELRLKPAGEQRMTMLVEILDRRAAELLTMSWQDKVEGSQRALSNYQAALQVGHKMLEEYQPSNISDTASAVQWQEALARNLAVLQGLADAMPRRMQPGIHMVIIATQKEHAWVSALLGKTPQAPGETDGPKLPERSPTPGQCLYTVKKGDTLSAIARRYNTTWQRLAALNSLASPDSILPGKQLIVPCVSNGTDSQSTPPAEFTLCPYTVRSGDTLSSIAERYNTTTRLLLAVNNLPSADRILAGQRLNVPCYVK